MHSCHSCHMHHMHTIVHWTCISFCRFASCSCRLLHFMHMHFSTTSMFPYIPPALPYISHSFFASFTSHSWVILPPWCIHHACAYHLHFIHTIIYSACIFPYLSVFSLHSHKYISMHGASIYIHAATSHYHAFFMFASTFAFAVILGID